MVHDMINTAYDGSNITIKQVTNIRTIADALQQSEIYRKMLSEIARQSYSIVFYISCYFCDSREIFCVTLKSKNVFEKHYEP